MDSNHERNSHCLLFVLRKHTADNAEKTRILTDSRRKGFVLVPSPVVEDDQDLVQLFVRNNFDILTPDNLAPLKEAIRRRCVDSLEFVIYRNPGKNIRSSKNTPLIPVPVKNCYGDLIKQYFPQDVAVFYQEDWFPCITCLTLGEKNSVILEQLLSISTELSFKNPDGETLLHLAVRSCDDIMLQLLMKHGVPLDMKRKDGATPLYVAVKGNNLRMAELLLQGTAAVNAKTKNGETCLVHACKNGFVPMIRLLLKNGADVNIGDDDGFMPLHFAVYCDDRDSIVFSRKSDSPKQLNRPLFLEILEAGASVNASASVNNTLITPLSLAVEEKKLDFVKCLIQHGADVNIPCYGDQTILQLAVDLKSPEIVREILKSNPDVNAAGNKEVLRKCILREDKEAQEIREILIQNGCVLNTSHDDSMELLHNAISKGYMGLVEKLLDFGVNINKSYYYLEPENDFLDRSTPLCTAIKFRRNDIVKCLIDRGADLHTNLSILEPRLFSHRLLSLTPINYANYCGNLEALKILLKYGASIDSINFDSINIDQLLRALCSIDDQELIEKVIRKWLGRHGPSSLPEFVLKFAMAGSAAMLLEVMKFNPSVDFRDFAGRQALHFVSCQGSVKLLIKYGADIEARCFEGQTPLVEATKRGVLEVVEELLQYGAKVDSIDNFGYSPLHYALLKDHMDVFIALVNHMFTDYELLLRTHILQFLQKSYLITSLRDQGLLELYNEEIFQEYTDTLFQVLMAMGQAFPDNKNLSIFVNQEIKSSFFGTNMEFDIGSGHHNSLRWETNSDYNRCSIEWAKSQTLGTSNVTVYDILTQNVQQLTLYMRNESIAEDLKLPKIASNFDSYKDILWRQIRKGTFRRKLLNQSRKLCHLLLANLEILPHDITEMILDFLTNQELEIVIHACNCIVERNKTEA